MCKACEIDNPELFEQQIKEYVRICVQIYERARKDPVEYERMKRVINEDRLKRGEEPPYPEVLE